MSRLMGRSEDYSPTILISAEGLGFRWSDRVAGPKSFRLPRGEFTAFNRARGLSSRS